MLTFFAIKLSQILQTPYYDAYTWKLILLGLLPYQSFYNVLVWMGMEWQRRREGVNEGKSSDGRKRERERHYCMALTVPVSHTWSQAYKRYLVLKNDWMSFEPLDGMLLQFTLYQNSSFIYFKNLVHIQSFFNYISFIRLPPQNWATALTMRMLQKLWMTRTIKFWCLQHFKYLKITGAS